MMVLGKYLFVISLLTLWGNLYLIASEYTHQIETCCTQLASEYTQGLMQLTQQGSLAGDQNNILKMSMESYYKRGLDGLKAVKAAFKTGQEDVIFSQFMIFMQDFLGYGEEEPLSNGSKETQKVLSKPHSTLSRCWKQFGKSTIVVLGLAAAFANFIPSAEAISIPLNSKYQDLCDRLVEKTCQGITYGALKDIQCPSLLPIELRDAFGKTVNATAVNAEETSHLCYCSEFQDESVRCISNIHVLEKNEYDSTASSTKLAMQVGSYPINKPEACDINSRLCSYVTFLTNDLGISGPIGVALQAQTSYHFKPDVTAELECLKNLMRLRPSYSALEELAAIYKKKPHLLSQWQKNIVDMVDQNSITSSEQGSFYGAAEALEGYGIAVSDEFLLQLYTQSLLRQENPHALVRYHLVLQRANKAPDIKDTLQRLKELDMLSQNSYENYSSDFHAKVELDFYAACRNDIPYSDQLSSCSFE